MPIRLYPGAWIFLEGYQQQDGGSLGLPVRELGPGGETRLLTAAHVVGALSVGRGATDRVFTSPFGPVPLASQHIGRSGHSVPDRPTLLTDIDAALIHPNGDVTCTRSIGGETETHAGYFQPDDPALDNLEVLKYGARTGLTRGRVCETGASLTTRTAHGAIRYSFGYWVMHERDGVPFALPGDSGSVVVARDGRVVGMLVAMQDPIQDPSAAGFVIPIAPILTALSIGLIGP